MPDPQLFTFAMLSDLGRVRAGNEDFCAASAAARAFIVCDGMGGAAAGEVASQLAATTFLTHLQTASASEGHLRASVQAANAAVHHQSQQVRTLHGMGTTLVALVLLDEHSLLLTHVGDSRCYRLRSGSLTQLTQDHSLVNEQVLAGQLTPEQAERSPMRNIITRSIGSHAGVDPEIQTLEPAPGDLYLLASDGLTRELTDSALTELLTTPQSDLDALCHALIEAANQRGGHDNITALLLRIQ